MSRTYHLGCPACAGVLEDAGETSTTRCPYCEVEILVTQEGTPRRFFLPPRLTQREQIEEKLRSCLVGSPAPLSYPQVAETANMRLLYLPFYEVVGTSLVRILDQVESGEDTRVSLRDLYMLEPALLEDQFGMRALSRIGFRDQEETELLPFSPEELPNQGVPFEADYSPEQLLANLERSAAEVRGRKGVAVQMVDARFTLVYLPVWEIRHRLERRVFTAYVDAIGGEVLRGHAPESRVGRNFLAHLLLFFVAWVMTGVIGQMASSWQLAQEGMNPLVAVDILVREGIAMVLAVPAGLVLLSLFRRILRPRGVELEAGTFRLPGSQEAGFLDGIAELLEVLVKTPVILLQTGLENLLGRTR